MRACAAVCFLRPVVRSAVLLSRLAPGADEGLKTEGTRKLRFWVREAKGKGNLKVEQRGRLKLRCSQSKVMFKCALGKGSALERQARNGESAWHSTPSGLILLVGPTAAAAAPAAALVGARAVALLCCCCLLPFCCRLLLELRGDCSFGCGESRPECGSEHRWSTKRPGGGRFRGRFAGGDLQERFAEQDKSERKTPHAQHVGDALDFCI